MNTRPVTNDDIVWLRELEGVDHATKQIFGAPRDHEDDVSPCETVVTQSDTEQYVRVWVPWKLDEIELAHLARGGTIWLSTMGGLPPHFLTVQEP